MILALDHLVILVRDLAEAVEDYEAIGFDVSLGGEHTDGATHNALVSFADGTYLELLAFQREAPEHIWWRHKEVGEGLIDFALLPGTIERDVAMARARGLAISEPFAGGRERSDGVRLTWQTARAEARELPFLCGDVTPRELRVPPPGHHPNGATSIFRVTVAVHNVEASAARYAALVGVTPIEEPGRRLFKLGATYIALQEPGAGSLESAAVQARLALRGEGIASVALRRDSYATVPRYLDPELTHGVRVVIA